MSTTPSQAPYHPCKQTTAALSAGPAQATTNTGCKKHNMIQKAGPLRDSGAGYSEKTFISVLFALISSDIPYHLLLYFDLHLGPESLA
jgi:hypothetical protein